jgi:hypothetical protein
MKKKRSRREPAPAGASAGPRVQSSKGSGGAARPGPRDDEGRGKKRAARPGPYAGQGQGSKRAAFRPSAGEDQGSKRAAFRPSAGEDEGTKRAARPKAGEDQGTKRAPRPHAGEGQGAKRPVRPGPYAGKAQGTQRAGRPAPYAGEDQGSKRAARPYAGEGQGTQRAARPYASGEGQGTFRAARPHSGGGQGAKRAARPYAGEGQGNQRAARPVPFARVDTSRPQRRGPSASAARRGESAPVLHGADELDAWSTRPVREQPGRFERRAPRRGLGLADEPVESDEQGPQGPRRPLSHVGGRVERLEGPAELTEAVRRALAIDPEQGVRDHVHGFHSYPARLHPVTAASLITSLTGDRATVGDPFCGCGTVLVEARRLGRKAVGVDLNPLAVRLSRFKTDPLGAAERDELLLAAVRVAEHAEERRQAKTGPTHRYSPALREAFDVHVLLELDGLSDGIKQEPPGYLRQALNLALSSIFSKVGKGSGAEGEAKRLASGFTIRFFESRVGELVRQLAEYEALLPAKAPGIKVQEADARELARLGLSNVDLFVSSPPYPGVLDYADYHRTRLSWLHLDAERFEQLEMGARRHLQRLDHEQAAAAWEKDFVQVLTAMRGALASGGHIALVLADSLLAGRPYPADVVVERCARRAGLAVAARGSQRRPHFHRQSAKAFGDLPRFEHLLLLRPG